MAIEVEASLAAALYASPGAARIVVETEESESAQRALERVRRNLRSIEHPEEPSEPFASWVSAVEQLADGVAVCADMADADAYAEHRIMERYVGLVVEALEAEGVRDGLVRAAPVTTGGSMWDPRPDPRTVALSRATAFDSEGLGLVELAAVIAGDEDIWGHPSVSPVLARIAAGLCRETDDDAEREALRPFAPRLAVSAARGDDTARRRRVLDWLVRELAPVTLEAVGLDGRALTDLPALSERFEPGPVFDALAEAMAATIGRLYEVDGDNRRLSPTHAEGAWRSAGSPEDIEGRDLVLEMRDAVGGCARGSGDRLEDLLRVPDPTAGLAEAGMTLGLAAWSIVWRQVAGSVWQDTWGEAYREACTAEGPPPSAVFGSFDEWWRSRDQALAAPIAKAAMEARRNPAAIGLWSRYIAPVLAQQQPWQEAAARAARVGADRWWSAAEAALVEVFDRRIAASLYLDAVDSGVAAVTGRTIELGRYLAFVSSWSPEPEGATPELLESLLIDTRKRVVVLLDELLPR